MLASLLLSMGALCDQRGARRVMLGGLAVFGIGGAAATIAPSLGVLIAAQLLLGAGAAALLPSSLALLTHAYPDDASRARAVGVYSGASAVAIAAGPVVGGALIELVSWRAVFAIDVPAALLLGLAVATRVAEVPYVRARHLDLAGQALAILTLAVLTFACIRSGDSGPLAADTLVPLAAALLLGGAFVAVERRGDAPMLPLSLFRARAFNVVTGAGLLVNFAVYGQLFVLSLYLQDVRGHSPLETGAVFAAVPLFAAGAAVLSGRITGRQGARMPTAVGGSIAVLATALLVTVDASTPLPIVIAALGLMGAGAGLMTPALTAAVVMESPRAQVGVATAAFTASRQTGGLLGVAILGAMVSSGDFVEGFHASLLVSGAALAVCALAGGLLIPRRVRAPILEPAPDLV